MRSHPPMGNSPLLSLAQSTLSYPNSQEAINLPYWVAFGYLFLLGIYCVWSKGWRGDLFSIRKSSPFGKYCWKKKLDPAGIRVLGFSIKKEDTFFKSRKISEPLLRRWGDFFYKKNTTHKSTFTRNGIWVFATIPLAPNCYVKYCYSCAAAAAANKWFGP